MGSNTNLIGKRYPPQTWTCDARTATAYAAATDDPNPRYQGDGAIAPPMVVVAATIPHGVAHVVSDEALIGDPARLLRLLHSEEDIRWYAPVRQGETFRVEASLEGLEERSSGEVLRVATVLYDERDDKVAESLSSLFIREKKPGGGRAAESGREGVPSAPTWSQTWKVAADQSERYAAASGDHNPIHLDEAIAQMAGLKGRVLHGLCTMAFAARAVVTQMGEGDPRRLTRLAVRFKRPVYMGDTLTCLGQRVANHIELVVKNQDEHAVLTRGIAELR
jgi:acyl dehydratase